MKTLLKLDQTIETIQTWFCALMFIMILIFGTIQVFGCKFSCRMQSRPTSTPYRPLKLLTWSESS